MPTSYKYKYKPKGTGYNLWATKQKHGKSYHSSKSGSGILSDIVADAIAGAIFGAKNSGRYKR